MRVGQHLRRSEASSDAGYRRWLALRRGGVRLRGSSTMFSDDGGDEGRYRGSAVQIGGLEGERSISASAEVEAVAKRLRHAVKSNDASVLQSAIECEQDVQKFASFISSSADPTWDPTIVEECAAMAAQMRRRLDTDPELKRFAAIRNSETVKLKVRRLWDLMVVESQTAAGDDSIDCVTRDGYRRFHLRLAKALTAADAFSPEMVQVTADMDWADDISRYSGTSHIAIWLDMVRNAFKEGANESVAIQGLTVLFGRYDADGSGDLSFEEFEIAVRKDLDISESTLTCSELVKLFKAVDVDGGGSVSTSELMVWLFEADKAKKKSKKEASRSVAQVKRRFKEASAGMCEVFGWDSIFKKYDADGSGELEVDEFIKAVRAECELTRDAVSDTQVQEMFEVIDTDGSGAIDSRELRELLNADLGGTSLNWSAFYSSILELTSVWSRNETPDQFVLFLQSLFSTVTEPVGKHATAHASAGGADLAELDIFADKGRTAPNFALKAIDDVETLVGESEDGKLRLQIEGFDSDIVDPKTAAWNRFRRAGANKASSLRRKGQAAGRGGRKRRGGTRRGLPPAQAAAAAAAAASWQVDAGSGHHEPEFVWQFRESADDAPDAAGWSSYDTETSAKLEAALSGGENGSDYRAVRVDAERFVDLKTMKQSRWDDRSQSRAVRRREARFGQRYGPGDPSRLHSEAGLGGDEAGHYGSGKLDAFGYRTPGRRHARSGMGAGNDSGDWDCIRGNADRTSDDYSGARSGIDTGGYGPMHRQNDGDGQSSPVFSDQNSPDWNRIRGTMDTGRRAGDGPQRNDSVSAHLFSDHGSVDVSHVRSKLDTGLRRGGDRSRRSPSHGIGSPMLAELETPDFSKVRSKLDTGRRRRKRRPKLPAIKQPLRSQSVDEAQTNSSAQDSDDDDDGDGTVMTGPALAVWRSQSAEDEYARADVAFAAVAQAEARQRARANRDEEPRFADKVFTLFDRGRRSRKQRPRGPPVSPVTPEDNCAAKIDPHLRLAAIEWSADE